MNLTFLKQVLKGVLIGVANIIPGVSGGTLAVSMGIYDQLILSITHLFKETKKSIKTLMPYGIGAVLGIVSLSFIIEWLFLRFPFEMNLFFCGLILGSVPILYSKVKGSKLDFKYVMAFLFMFLLVIGMSLFKSSEMVKKTLTLSDFQWVKLFIVGVIASATMIIPGVSGSMILTLMGYYLPILESVNHCIKSLIQFKWVEMFTTGILLVPFGIGVLVGIFLIAKLIEILLKHAEKLVYWGILGLVVGSPIAILITSGVVISTTISLVSGILCFIVGGLIAYSLSK